MKLLKKILLINWHMFECCEFDVEHNMLISGENGAGKSTLLDAIQFVLTGGKGKFNLAANASGRRTIEGYVRGRIGSEGKTNLRNGDVTTHIALEFYDDEAKVSFVLGSVIELPENGTVRDKFYSIYRAKINKEWYIKDGKTVLRKMEMDKQIKKSKCDLDYANSKQEAQSKVRYYLGVSKKYTDLLPRALAFKPIDDLNFFIYQFLLPVDKINIDSLRENIHRYREFEAVLDEQKVRLDLLSSLNDFDQKRLLELKNLKITSYLTEIIDYEILCSNLKLESEKKDKLTNDNKQLSNICEKLTVKIADLHRQISDFEFQLNSNVNYSRKKELENRKKNVEIEFEKAVAKRRNLLLSLEKEISLFNRLGIKHSLSPIETMLDDLSLDEAIDSVKEKLKNRRKKNTENHLRIANELEKIKIEHQELEGRLNTLKQKRFVYKPEVTKLIEVLEVQLSAYYSKEIKIRPLCEYLEIKDERWRNAVEGFLNTQRFDLIIEPEHFKRASLIYEQMKEKEGLFNIGVVDVGKLGDYDVPRDGTLAQKVTCENGYARRYANLLLGKIMCEEDVTQLRNHKRAITPTCMMYNNHSVRALNPKIYNRPFIGQNAIRIQLQETEALLNENVQKLKAAEQNMQAIQKENVLLESSGIERIYDVHLIQTDYSSSKEELDLVKMQLNEIKMDDSWITLDSQLKVLQDLLNDEQKNHTNKSTQHRMNILEIENLDNQIKASELLISEFEKNKIDLEIKNADILKDAEERLYRLKRDARSDLMLMKSRNQSQIQRNQDALHRAERDLIDSMHSYNLRTSFGFEESIQSIDLYLAQYHKLRDIDIEQSKEKSRIAREKCEESFREDFISKLREKINESKKQIRKLNQNLASKPFNGDVYEFIVKANEDPGFKKYYEILCSNEDYLKDTLFMDELSETNRQLMDELFNKLASTESDSRSERYVQEYTDYRKYMSYDIKIHHENGDVTLFSKVNKEKSGGETQTPYYVIIAASFDLLVENSRSKSQAGCLVLFDEAFNNMDEGRIEAMMKFYSQLNIQLMIAVPPGRVRSIMPYVETTMMLVNRNNRISYKEFHHDV